MKASNSRGQTNQVQKGRYKYLRDCGIRSSKLNGEMKLNGRNKILSTQHYRAAGQLEF